MDLPEHRLECVRGPGRDGGDEKHPIAPRPPTPPRFLSALTTAAGSRGRSPRAHPRPTAGLPDESPRLPPRLLESRWQDPRRGAGRPPRQARRFLSAQRRASRRECGRGRAGPRAGRCSSYLGQRPHAPPAAARPEAPGAAGAPRGGAAGAFLLSRRRRRRLPGRAQNIHRLCPGSRPPRPGRSPHRMPGASEKFFVSLTCSFASARPLRTPQTRSLPSPLAAASPRPDGQFSPGLSGSHSRTASLAGSGSEKSAPCARRLPSRGSLRGGRGGSSCSARSLSCSQPPSTCHFPPTLQPSARAPTNGRGGPRPATQRPLLLPLNTRTLPDVPQVVAPAPPLPHDTSNLQRDLSPVGPWGHLTERETEAQGDLSGFANRFVAE